MDTAERYATTRAVARVVSGAGWAFVGVGALLIVLGFAAGRGFGLMTALFPGLGLAAAGLFLVVQGQVLRALVDIASNTGATLLLLQGGRLQAGADAALAVSGPLTTDSALGWDQGDVVERGTRHGREFVVAHDGRVRARTLTGVREFASVAAFDDYVQGGG